MSKKIQDDFEGNLSRLQEISKLISEEDITLDMASKLYEEGMKLSHLCQEYIKEKELIIQKINEEM